MTEAFHPQPSSFTPANQFASLTPGMTVPAAVERIVKNQFTVFNTMLPIAYQAKDIEGVHKVRVSLRRMRTCLKVTRGYYQRKKLFSVRHDLKFIRQVFGRVRDMDVFYYNFTHTFADTNPDEDFQKLVWEPVFDQTYQELYTHIRSPMTQEIILRLSETLERYQSSSSVLRKQTKLATLPSNLASFLPLILNQQLLNIKQFKLDNTDDPHYVSHHKLRQLIKEHRYTYEFFQSVLAPESTTKAIAILTSLQDKLGDLNDSVQAARLITNNLSIQHEERTSRVLEAYHHQQQKKQSQIATAFPNFLSEFLHANPQFLLDEAIDPLIS